MVNLFNFSAKQQNLLQIQKNSAMIRMFHVRKDVHLANAILQVFRNHVIVNAPAEVLGAGAGTEAPPAIAVGFLHQLTEAVDVAVAEEIRHPLAFFGQEAR